MIVFIEKLFFIIHDIAFCIKIFHNFAHNSILEYSNRMGSKILIPACTALDLFYKVLTVEHTSPDHSTQVFIIRHNGIHQIKEGWI